MDTWMWVVIAAVAAVVALALIVMMIRRKRSMAHSDKLRESFGSEYDHVVQGSSAKERKEREADLERRQMRRDTIDIRPLPAMTREHYANEWANVQLRFVDEPERSVEAAEHLVVQVMAARGYPVAADFENQAELMSVDHPDLVANYRSAHDVYERSRHHHATTEELRSSVVAYRALFEELLSDAGSTARSS